jgi:large subunit ribosomal protein L9
MTKAQARKPARRTTFKRLPKGPHGGIQLLLIQSVDHLGKQGDVVEVKPGYANNYLLPQGLATLASDHHQRMVEKHRAQLMEIEKARLSDLRVLAEALTKQSITIEANANDEGHLYGSVGAPEIVAVLKQNQFHLTNDQIRLEGPLKELGLYTVKVHLHQEIEAELKVWVVPTAVAAEKTAEKPAAEQA